MEQGAIEQHPGRAEPPLELYGIPPPIWEHYYSKCVQGSLESAEESVGKKFKGGYKPSENNMRAWGTVKSNLIDCLFDVFKPIIIHEYNRREAPKNAPVNIIETIRAETDITLRYYLAFV